MQDFEDPVDVLLVDDSHDVLDILTQGLAQAGLSTQAVSSAEEALAYLQDHEPEAILLDVMMAGMDGFETCQRIRADNRELPVIFMTGLGETKHIVRGFEVGGTDYVTKPLSLPVVIARLQSHTRTARLVRATREAISATGTAMLACDNLGHLLWCNDAARRLIAELAPDLILAEGQAIPAPLVMPVAGPDNGESPPSQIPFTSGNLEISRATEWNERVSVFLLKRANAQNAPQWKPPRLTERESEVLLWVARGKTNRDIGDILGLSPRTINKHLEHIFEKLGVETRTAAAAIAAQQLGLS